MKKKISIIITLIVILINLIPLKSSAATPIDTAYIYANKKTDGLLMWNGLKIHTHMAVYKKDGKEYPAYCMDRELSGVEIGFSQTVDVNKLISNVKVWRAIINGYPYKSISELGCKTEEEAYLATKQAIYSMLTDRDVSEYSAIGESGERCLNALKQILKNARSSSATKPSSELKIKQENSLWKIDSIDKQYVSQTFTVSADATFDKYTVDIKNMNIEGFKITDKNNKERKEFKSGEQFKILIPITNIIEDGDFTINVSGQIATKPVFYGQTRDSNLQNYALTGYTYEDGSGAKKVYYSENGTKIVIVKKDETGTKKLQGVEFELLDEEQNVLHTGLTTNENGEIEINNLLPGTYYIRETRTLEGYELYNKLIKIELELNEKTTVNVINSEEEPEITINNIETEISVEQSKSEVEIQESSNKIEIQESDDKIEMKNEENKVVVKLPKTGM
ncbi:MAG: Cys-Gln thioester bond-forming surface protein [Clostridia bacterium]|nr:Cys-Gln thioester bond-forming surface protein [Clostridia bacterium]